MRVENERGKGWVSLMREKERDRMKGRQIYIYI